MAENVIALGVLQLPLTCSLVPVKSNLAEPLEVNQSSK